MSDFFEFQVGDLVEASALDAVPVGTVLTLAPGDRWDDSWNVITKLSDGSFGWWSEGHELAVNPHRRIHVGTWRVAHLSPKPKPKPKAPEVDDVVTSAAQAALLPIGSVVVDTVPGDDPEVMHPAIKVDVDEWMWFDPQDGPMGGTEDELFTDNPHRVLHIPDSADAGTGRTAA